MSSPCHAGKTGLFDGNPLRAHFSEQPVHPPVAHQLGMEARGQRTPLAYQRGRLPH
jgi:hypothetical protein